MLAPSHTIGQVEYTEKQERNGAVTHYWSGRISEQFPRADGVYESKAAPVCSNLLANIVNLVEHEMTPVGHSLQLSIPLPQEQLYSLSM